MYTSWAAGLLPPSGGAALIHGQDISSEGGLDVIRPLMGVCPQFDVLWNELTGLEHLMIYGHVKGIRFSQVRAGRGGSKASCCWKFYKQVGVQETVISGDAFLCICN